MKNLFGWMLAALLALTVGVSCSDDDDLNEGAGIASPAWKAENQAVIEGETLDFEFTAEGRWTAVSSADWCEVKTPSGVAGESLLRLKVAKNNLAEARTATITVHVKGYAASASFVVKQAEGTTEQGDGKYRSVNEWVADYMKNFYLWNRPIENLFLDYSLSYDRFFTSILDGVAAQDDVNHDDGFWQGQKRMYYYSNLQSDAPVSRAPGQTQSGSGIYLLQATRLGTDYIGFAVMAVVPGTPADDAGLVRGDFITSVNGVEVTDANYKTLGQYVYDGSVEIAVSQVTWEDNGSTPVLSSKGNIQLGAASFTDPAIYMDKVVGIDGTEKKVGYLLYMGFNIDYDDELMAAFERFRQQNVTDLILDLRYNNGGDVLSSAVLGTLVAGNDYKGQVYAHTTFNEDRTEAGEGGDYKIGVKETVERIYEPLETALQHAVGLKKIYVLVSQTTASASEMVINGLRGLDIEVNLIGQTTNGKNVGMEGVMRSFYNHEFLLYPVTFGDLPGGVRYNGRSARLYCAGVDQERQEAGTPGFVVDTRRGQSDEAFRRLVGYPSHTTDGRCRHASPDGRVVFRFSYAAEASVQGSFALFISDYNFFVEKTPLFVRFS